MEKTTFTKLNGKNFFSWKFKMEMVLSDMDLWSCIKEAVPTADTMTTENKKKNRKAMEQISLCVEDEQLIHIRSYIQDSKGNVGCIR